MDITKTLDSAARVLIDPSYHDFTTVEKGLAWTTTILTAIISLGTAHVLSALWRHLRQVEENDTHRMISSLFYEIFGMKKEMGIDNAPAAQLNSTTVTSSTTITPVTSQEIVSDGTAVLTPLPTSTQLVDPEVKKDSTLLPEPLSLVRTIGQERGRNISFGDFTNEDKEVPSDVIQKIFGYFNTKELNGLAQISARASHEITSMAKQKIQDTINNAHLIDTEIKKLTEGTFSLIGTNEIIGGYTDKEPLCATFFKFDEVKWKEVLNDLENALQTGTTVINSSFLIKECELDLIEALAEYNVRRYHILNDQDVYETDLKNFIQTTKGTKEDFERQNRFLDLLFKDNDLKNFSPTGVTIINAARNTCKFSLHLTNKIVWNPNEYKSSMEIFQVPTFFPMVQKHSIGGPFLSMGLEGCECEEGKAPKYRVPLPWTYINIDWLMGKKQGDRFIVKTKEYFIIRLIQPEDITIEKLMTELVCSFEACQIQVFDLKNKGIESKVTSRLKSLFQQLEDAYGKDLLNNAKEKRKIKNPRDLSHT